MKLRFFTFFAIIIFASFTSAFSQADSVIGQITNTASPAYVGGISGDGRFVVFESRGNLATVNPRNTDGNIEIFLFDYAQRRIFQITDTKSVLFDPNGSAILQTNVRVEIANVKPVISTDGRWISFASNATTSVPGTIDGTNPGNFNGNSFSSPTPTPTPTVSPTPTPSGSPTPTPTPAANPLTSDGNMEIWMYQIPIYTPADLSSGVELPLIDLGVGTFTQVTNTPASQLPRPGTALTAAFIADDNHDVSISDDGSLLAFASISDLVPAASGAPAFDTNEEIFTYSRTAATINQITNIARGPLGNPVYSKYPTIAGNGSRIVFVSTGENPIPGMKDGDNPETSRNLEVHVADLDPNGAVSSAPGSIKRQVTVTTPTAVGGAVNFLDPGKRMSRNGKYVLFDSNAEFTEANAPSPTINTAFATFLYDVDANTFKQVLGRSDIDTGSTGGDVQRYPGFTDYDGVGQPATVVLESRMNIGPDGLIPTDPEDGLNNDETRPVQIYTYPLAGTPTNGAEFSRITKMPSITGFFLPQTQPITSDSAQRMSFSINLTEFGSGNPDLSHEAYYLLTPSVNRVSTAKFRLQTGASRMNVSDVAVPTPTPTPTPSPTATPTPTPTPTPSGSPTPTPSPSPTPTPVTPIAVHGISPGMLTVLTFNSNYNQPTISQQSAGSLDRSFNLPIELSGVTVTINGVACGIKSVGRNVGRFEIILVTPVFLGSTTDGTEYPIVIFNNGTIVRDTVTIVPTRPDLFSTLAYPAPGGRIVAQNVTNRVFTTEPFMVRTLKYRGGQRVPSVIRIKATGIANASSAVFTIRIGGVSITGGNVLTGSEIVEPGVYTVDFLLPDTLNHAGDQPVVLIITANGVTFSSRLDDTAPRVTIL